MYEMTSLRHPQVETQQSCTWFTLWNHKQSLGWVLLHANLFGSCCATCFCLIRVCELQGVVSGVFDSLLSHKECFQSLPHFHWDKKKKCCVSTYFFPQKLCVPCWQKNMHPILAYGWHTNVRRGLCSSQLASFLSVWPVRSVRKLKWHFFIHLQTLSGAMVTEVWKLCIRQLQGPVTLEVRENKTGGCQNLSQAVWNPAKPWNEQFLSPSLSKLPYFSLSLTQAAFCLDFSPQSLHFSVCLPYTISCPIFLFLSVPRPPLHMSHKMR